MTAEVSPDVMNVGEARTVLDVGSCHIDWEDGYKSMLYA